MSPLCIKHMCIVTSSSVPKDKFDQRNIQLDRVDKLFQAHILHINVYDTTRSIHTSRRKQLHDCTMNETLFGIILDWCIMKNNPATTTLFPYPCVQSLKTHFKI